MEVVTTPPPEPRALEVKEASAHQPSFIPKLPQDALPLELTAKESVLYHVQRCEYLSHQQISELVFSHQKEESRKANTSRAISDLSKDKKLKSTFWKEGKIAFAGKQPNPRDHDLMIRDLYVKIFKSNFKIIEAKFFNSIDGAGILNPDLSITFESSDQKIIQTFWEYDAGTEGDKELLTKVQRYLPYFQTSVVVFVFQDHARLEKFITKASHTPSTIRPYKTSRPYGNQCSLLHRLTAHKTAARLTY